MKNAHLMVLSLMLAFSLFAQNEDAKLIGVCSVRGVYSGPNGSFIELRNCKGDLGFTEKDYTLKHHLIRAQETKSSNTTYVDRVDLTVDALALKQTAELAMLFQRKVRVQLAEPNSNIIDFMSLDESIDLLSNREWKPVNGSSSSRANTANK